MHLFIPIYRFVSFVVLMHNKKGFLILKKYKKIISKRIFLRFLNALFNVKKRVEKLENSPQKNTWNLEIVAHRPKKIT